VKNAPKKQKFNHKKWLKDYASEMKEKKFLEEEKKAVE